MRGIGATGISQRGKMLLQRDRYTQPIESSPVMQKTAGTQRFEHCNGKPSQSPNALTLDRRLF
jgi:hypothetical protein